MQGTRNKTMTRFLNAKEKESKNATRGLCNFIILIDGWTDLLYLLITLFFFSQWLKRKGGKRKKYGIS